MEINKMVCEYCGKVFYDKYNLGGYIDHYTNFAQHKEGFGEDVDDDVQEICFDGNDLRDNKDIEERLNCYLKWDNVPDDIKNQVKEKCEFLIDKIVKAKERAKEIVSNLTMLERKYIIDAAKENCSTPYGYEDEKLWDEF